MALMERARDLVGVIMELRRQGLTIQRINEVMNERRTQTAKGARWHVPTVHRLVKRVESIVKDQQAVDTA
jgi:hypothetical protein